MTSAANVDKSGGRIRFLLLLASFAGLNLLHQTRGGSWKENEPFTVTSNANNATGRASSKSIGFEELVPSSSSSSPAVVEEEEEEEPSDNITIYLADPSSGDASSADYISFASTWHRTTTYDDILRTSSTANAELRRKLLNQNVTVIFHTSPKTASSTLRKACLETQYDTCHLPRKPAGNTWPNGYRTPKVLTGLFAECPATRHFCAKEYIPVTRGYAKLYDARNVFLHAFPFRNYDEWARSALRQVRSRDGEEGCRETEDELLDECRPHPYELNFERYTKSFMANFVYAYRKLRSSNPKVNDDRHVFLVYRYDALHETLSWLNDAYGVPLLRGTNASMNSARRPDESCDDEERMLAKFHDCFSDRLAGLRFEKFERGEGGMRGRGRNDQSTPSG